MNCTWDSKDFPDEIWCMLMAKRWFKMSDLFEECKGFKSDISGKQLGYVDIVGGLFMVE